MIPRRGRTVTSCALGALLLFTSCDDPQNVLPAPSVDPTGDWTMTTTEVVDSCDRSSVSPLIQDVRVTQSGDRYEMLIEDQPCSSQLVMIRNIPTGIATYTHSSGTNSTSSYCMYRKRSDVSITITQDTISGTSVDTWTFIGTNNYYYAPTTCPSSCVLQRTIEGQRCQGCYSGCL